MDGKLIDLKASDLLRKFGAGSHKPGSGSAAALQGILGAHLLRTVILLTKDERRSKTYSAHLDELLEIESDLENRLLPELEEFFHEDSRQFDIVIKLRKRREATKDPQQKIALADEAASALIPATEIPIEIARRSLEIAKFGLQVFDHGFQSARGDSGVAVNAALASAAGCLSIIELNLLSFGANDWTKGIQEASHQVRSELQELQSEAEIRLSGQFSMAEENTYLHHELQAIRTSLKGKSRPTEAEIEQLATHLQRTLWRYRRLIWKNQDLENPFHVLKPERVLRLFGFHVDRSTTLGTFAVDGRQFEVAGQIDQEKGIVALSDQFPKHVQNLALDQNCMTKSGRDTPL